MTSPNRTATKKPAAKKATAKKAPARKRPTKRPAAKPAAAARVTPRDRKVVQRRQAGKSLGAIARELKYRDAAAVHQAYERALNQTLPPPPDQQRQLELQKLADREDTLWPKADGGSLAAIHELAQIHLERTRLKATGPVHQHGPRRVGPVEAATIQECEALAKNAPSLAAAAVVLARLVDNTPEDGVGYSAAARELRMSMSNLRGLAGLQAPDGRSEEDQAAEGGPRPGDHTSTGRDGKPGERGGRVVVEPSRLQQLRERGDRG